MPFGYLPNRIFWKDLVLRIIGFPSMIRRLQALVIMRMLEPKEGETVLDAGCGKGFFTYEIAKKSKMSIGIDWKIDSTLLSFVMHKQPKVAFMKGDVQKLPFTSERFDKVLLSSVLAMVKNDEVLLEECYRVLKEKGSLVLSVPMEYCCLRKLNNLKPQLKKKFGTLGKGYYDFNEIIEFLRNKSFEVMEIEYSPKKWGSLIFEIGVFLWYHFNFPFFDTLFFPIVYSIAYFDRFTNNKQIGNELIIKASKVQR